ncbi:MAG: transglutaminase domain-containing protein [Chloroflexi bacterium]|nr:transglutaminase domain-containing protein [Chloroflexota bacterium]
MNVTLVHWARFRLSSFFSSQTEDSFRLRMLALAGLWVAALGLAWVGGDLRFCLAGGFLGTAGHWFGYKMRNRPSRVRPLLIAVLVIALSIMLRNDMVKAFTGDWIPVGQYLVLVSGLATFDSRTRGGLYTGLVLSGMVLFFASQQAFDISFGIFVVGFVVVLMAFMLLTYLEDMIRTAHVYWTKNSAAILVYWVGAICAMFLLAGLAFATIPRGNSNLFGPPDLAVLPYSGSDIDIQPSLSPTEQEDDSPVDISVGEPSDSKAQAGGLPQGSDSPVEFTAGDSIDPTGETNGLNDGGPESGPAPQVSTLKGDQSGGSMPGPVSAPSGDITPRTEQFPDGPPASVADESGIPNPSHTTDGGGSTTAVQNRAGSGGFTTTSQAQAAFRDDRSESGDDPVVFHVRSKVASYWRGLVFEVYDGSRWLVSDLNNKMIESLYTKGTWYNAENQFSSDNVNYSQTFYLIGDDELPMITGYRSLQVVVNDKQSEANLLTSGSSYSVISSVPNHSPAQLRNDSARGLSPELTILPSRLEPSLSQLATTITGAATNDLEILGRIISYLNTETDHVTPGPSGISSMATLDQFLFHRVTGSVLDYATAMVMLARASGMPARLAVGYLPGERDPLTGTYRVRESDRHAWAEVRFDWSGWVPFDGAPRYDPTLGLRPKTGLTSWLTSGVGEEVVATLKGGPRRAFEALTGSVSGPVLWALAPSLGVIMLIGVWFRSGYRRRLRNAGRNLLSYAVIPGDRRREIKKLYTEVERLIRRDAGAPRADWQTAGDYASIAADRSAEIDDHLTWFTQAIWLANYRSADLNVGMVTEGRSRLALLKKAFGALDKQKPGLQS